MKPTTVQTQMLGYDVQITMGLPADYDFASKREKNSRWVCWQYIGCTGTVRAVYQDKDGSLLAMLELYGPEVMKDQEVGKLVEIDVKNLTVKSHG